MAGTENTIVANGKATYVQGGEIVEGDPEFDGRVIIYVIKGEKAEEPPPVARCMGLYSEPFLSSASRRNILHQLYETADPRARARCSSCHLHHRHAQPVVLLDPPGALRTRHPRPRPGHGRGRYRLRRDGLSPVSSRSVRQEGGLDGPDGSREGGRHVLDRVSDGRDWASCQIQRAPPPPRPWKMAC